MVVTFPGAQAVSSLAQDAREAGGAIAPLMVVARAAVLTAQHRVVTHSSCRGKAERAGGRQEGVINRSLSDREAENINRQVHRAQAASSRPVCVALCPSSTADTLGRAKPRTFVNKCREEEEAK